MKSLIGIVCSWLLFCSVALGQVGQQPRYLQPVVGGGGGGVSFSFKASAVGGGGTGVTLSSMTIGTTVTSDIVVVIISNDGGVLPTGVTVGGNTATALATAADNTGVDTLSMWYLSGVTLGSTSNVAITSGGTMFNVGAMVGVISGSASPTPTIGSAVAFSFTDPFVISNTVPSGGIGIAVVGQLGTPVGSWTNATQDTSFSRTGGSTDLLAHTALGSGATISPTYTGFAGNANHGIMGVWGP